MYKLTEIYRLRISKEQKLTLEKLKLYNINVPKFIRQAIKEKIEREKFNLKLKKQYCPF